MSLHTLLCICHIVSLFGAQKHILELLCVLNINYYEPTGRFVFAQQVLIYCVYFYGLFSILASCTFSNVFEFDRYGFIIFIMPCLNYVVHRNFALHTLNEMVSLHHYLHKTMGELLCTSVKKANCWAYIIIFELLATIYWQLTYFLAIQIMCVLLLMFVFYMQFLLHGNSFIWLNCIYVAMNRVFSVKLTYKQRLKMLRGILSVQPKVRQLEQRLGMFFSLYVFMLVILLLFKMYAAFLMAPKGCDPELQRVVLLRMWIIQLRYVINILILLTTMLLLIRDFSLQRARFERNLWELKHKPEDFYQRLLDYKFLHRGLPRAQQRLDVVDLMLVTNNQPYKLHGQPTLMFYARIGKTGIGLPGKCLAGMLCSLIFASFGVVIVALANGFELSIEYDTVITIPFTTDNSTIWAIVLAKPVPCSNGSIIN